MPKNYAKKYYKQKYRGKSRGRKKTTAMKLYKPLPLNGRPPNQVVKMRYSQLINFPYSLASASFHVFRANSIFDPDHSGTGHQPMGHDQWAQFYNHYRVLGSKIRVDYLNEDTAQPALVGCFLDDDATTTATFKSDHIIETGRGRWKTVSSVAPSTGKPLVLKYSAKRFHNAVDVKDRNDLKATFGTNPSEQAYYIVWGQDVTGAGTSSPAVLYLQVTIDYIVSLEEWKDLPSS